MRGLRKWVWAVLAAAAATTPAVAQQSSNALSGSSGTAGATSTGNSGGGGGGGSGGGTGANSGGQQGGSGLQGLQQAPSLTAPSGTASSSLSSTNFLSGYYANPYYQGLITAQTNATPGGFGTALYGNSTSGTGSVNRGTAGGNNQNSTQISGILIPVQVQINYSAQMRFTAPPVPVAQIQAELREAINGSISNSKSVQVITDANNNVVLRGSVKDDEELRLVEGLVRITPGVRAITNELTVTPPAVGVAAAGK